MKTRKLDAFAIVEVGKDIKYPQYPLTGIKIPKLPHRLVNATFITRDIAVEAKKMSDKKMKQRGMRPLSVKIVPCIITYKI